MRRAIGFLVWNPARSLPTVQHETIQSAEAEAERLRGENPGETFWVMSPITTAKAGLTAKAFSEGKAEGLAQANAEIMMAEGRADRFCDDLRNLRRAAGDFVNFRPHVAEHQATVADCLLWFDGFNAAFSRDDRQPFTPEREKIRRLNEALQRLVPGQNLGDEEIPF